MKKIYSAPVMYREAYVMDQYIAAGDCDHIIATFPDHGHVSTKNNGSQIHCAFTSSNCGTAATGCINSTCGSSEMTPHKIITQGTNLKASTPGTGHNCHILDTKEDALYFAKNYKDRNCGNGVADLMGLKNFDEMKTAFS